MTDGQTSDLPVKPKVEIGWVLYDGWEPQLSEAVSRAAEDARRRLCEQFPNFNWSLPLAVRPQLADGLRAEPVSLLDVAEFERDSRGWDFVIILTQRELVTFERPFAFAVTSRLYAAAIVSIARIAEEESGCARLVGRLVVLSLHLFGRLNGLRVSRDGGYMRAFDTANELDEMSGYSMEDAARMNERLASVADLRVEETDGRYQGSIVFYARSLKENQRELFRAVARMRPWMFPARLTRLVTAAGSALLLLMVTAEAWELALSLRGMTVALLSVIALIGTSAYLLRAQRLLARGGDARLREQRVVRNVGTAIGVFIGMLVTYVAIFVISLVFGLVLFPSELVADWADQRELSINMAVRTQMAGFASMFGLVLGALGASFEPQGYFRHVTYVDEEI